MKNIREEILNTIDIVEEMKTYIELEKSGQNYKCICPFHEDTNPSLTVSEEKKIFKCFVCGEGGTIIDFVQKFEKISYSSALNKLAVKIGLEVKENKKSNYNIILDNINIFYQKILLNSDLGSNGLNYFLNDRKLTRKEIEKFSLGYSPKDSSILYTYITDYIKQEKYSILDLEKLNIFNENNLDILNNRVIFPIYDEKNFLVGFSGRTLDGNIKYINSKQSEIFNKKKILYNFNEIIKNNSKDMIIVEGFLDVITPYKFGIKNIAATMGVAFSDEHIKLLKKYGIQDVYLGFDNDMAGKKATYTSARELLSNNFSVKILDYGNYKDIDEYLNENKTSEEMLKKTSLDFPLYLVRDIIEENLTIDEKSKITNEVCSILKYYKDETKKILLAKEVAKKLAIDPSIILNNIKNTDKIYQDLKIKKTLKPTSNSASKSILFDKEKLLFYIIANDYEKFKQLENYINIGEFEFWLYLNDYNKLKELYKSDTKIDYITLLDELEFYNDIDKEFTLYKTIDIEHINIDNYFNKEKKEKINKMKKLF